MIDNYKKQDLEVENKRLEEPPTGPTDFASVDEPEISNNGEQFPNVELPKTSSPIAQPFLMEKAGLRINCPAKTTPWDGGFDSSFEVHHATNAMERKRRKSEPQNNTKEVSEHFDLSTSNFCF